MNSQDLYSEQEWQRLQEARRRMIEALSADDWQGGILDVEAFASSGEVVYYE